MESSPFFDSHERPLLEAWAAQLDQAGEQLWAQEWATAQAGFEAVRESLDQFKPEPELAAVRELKRRADLGLWAVRYLQNPAERAAYLSLMEGGVESAAWMFVSRVFVSRKDVSAEALTAYRINLKQSRTPRRSSLYLDLIEPLSYSPSRLRLLRQIAESLPDDPRVYILLSRWHSQAGAERAAQVARAMALQAEELAGRSAAGCEALPAQESVEGPTEGPDVLPDPVSEISIQALLDAGDYAPAVARLRILAQREGAGTAKPAKEALEQVYERWAESSIRAGRWDEALAVIEEGRRVNIGNPALKQLEPQAWVGWGEDELRRGNAEAVIGRLTRIRRRIGPELPGWDQLLSRASIERARKFLQAEEWVQAATAVEDALAFDGTNSEAQTFARVVYRELAQFFDRSGDLSNAVTYAKKAYRWESTAENAGLLAAISRDYAVQLYEEARKHPLSAVLSGVYDVDVQPVSEMMSMSGRVSVRHGLPRPKADLYRHAIRLLEEVLALPCDSRGLSIEPLLSCIYNDLGVYAYRECDSVEVAVYSWRRALHYDPDNRTASDNLSGVLN